MSQRCASGVRDPGGSRQPFPGQGRPAAGQLLVSLRIDSEAVVRSNCIWALGRLMDQLVQPRQAEIVEAW